MKKPYVILLLFLVWACTGARSQNFNLQLDREPIASLDSKWRFQIGDNPAWASPAFDDSQWPLLRSDRSWTQQGYPGYGGYAWYRFTVQVPNGKEPIGLLLTSISTGYRLYANGKFIGSAGSTAPTRDPSYAPETFFQLPASVAGSHQIQIALRVWNYPAFASWAGGGTGGPGSEVGDSALLKARVDRDRTALAASYVDRYTHFFLALTVGITILALFLFRKEDREYLWFAILLISAAANAALYFLLGLNLLPYSLFILLDLVTGAGAATSALAFFSTILHVRRSFWWWAAFVAASISPLSAALFYFGLAGVAATNAVLLCCLVPAYIWIIAALLIRALQRDRSARLLLVPALLFYGFELVYVGCVLSWQLGWQRKLRSVSVQVLQRPFPLSLADIIHYIFILALLIFLVRRFSIARQEETRLSGELEAARSMQSLLIPAMPTNTPGFAVESVYLPASEVGGDFFQVLPGGDGSLLIVVGDVSGKGLKAAMTVITIVGALRNEKERRPAVVLNNLNRVLHGQISGFVTCAATLLEADGSMTIANAGHLAPYRNGAELPVDSGLPIGIVAEADYGETRCELAPGDRLTFVSDGVVEAANEKRELFGFERTQAISNQSAQFISDTAQRFGQQDDISVVAITRLPALPEPTAQAIVA